MTARTTTIQPASASTLKQLIIRHPLVAYFVLAFGGSWGLQLPMLLSRDGFGLLPYSVPMLPFMLLFLLSTYAGPTLAALLVTATEGGPAGVRAHLRRYVQWRVGLRWYLVVLLGLLHGVWHLPIFVYTGGPVAIGPFDLSTFALNTALIAVVTIVWTWVYNNTGGSILLAVLLHSSFNASQAFIVELIPAFPEEATLFVTGVYVVIALLLVVATRGRLSYRGVPSRDTAATSETGAMAPARTAG